MPHSSDFPDFDVIVVGTGGFGSSCLFHLARRGLRVLGLDPFATGHDKGSSHGDTRIIRKAYFEHIDYVPLLLRSYALWSELEAESGRHLMQQCGLVACGPPDGETIPGIRSAAANPSVSVEEVGHVLMSDRLPGFRVPDGFEAIIEPDAGYIHVEESVRTHVELACRHGAEFLCGESVKSWASDGRRVSVRTESQRFEAASLVITPGPWAPQFPGLEGVLPKLTLKRKPLLWHGVRSNVHNIDRNGIAFYYEMPYGLFYGFPSIDGKTLKVAEHSGGRTIDDPLKVERSMLDEDVDLVARFLQEAMPELDPTPTRHAVCIYTMTPDQHFIVGRHPEYSNVAIGAGFSGHGFKFTPVIGEALADLATECRTELPIEFLSPARFN